MRDYFISVLTAALLGGVATVVFVGTSFEKYIKYVCSLIAVFIILMPLYKLVPSFENERFKCEENAYGKEDASELMYSYLGEHGKDALERFFIEDIYENCGIKPRSVSIDIEYANENIILNGGVVTLDENDKSTSANIQKYLTDNYRAIKWTVS